MSNENNKLQEQVDYIAKQLSRLTENYTWYEDYTDEERERYDNDEEYGVAAYLQDAYNIDYAITPHEGWNEVRGARYCVAFGGPNIYIDTVEKKVQGYWWSDYAEADIPEEAIKIINEWSEEVYYCTH